MWIGLPLVTAALLRSVAALVPVEVAVESVDVPGDREAWVVRGAAHHDRAAVFFAGICSSPLWYLHTFPWAAVEYGDVVGVQGDTSCGGMGTRWRNDPALVSRRTIAALERAGAGDAARSDVTVIGYSQGATRAEALAAFAPDRYRRFILIGSPIDPSPEHFAHARGVVLMAGAGDAALPRMRDAADRFATAGIPVRFFVLPGANHGEMGPEGAEVMSEALGFLARLDPPHEQLATR